MNLLKTHENLVPPAPLVPGIEGRGDPEGYKSCGRNYSTLTKINLLPSTQMEGKKTQQINTKCADLMILLL